MICDDCRTAGDLNSYAAEATQNADFLEARSCLEEAIEYHAKCLGRASCNCQHRVGVFVKQ